MFMNKCIFGGAITKLFMNQFLVMLGISQDHKNMYSISQSI